MMLGYLDWVLCLVLSGFVTSKVRVRGIEIGVPGPFVASVGCISVVSCVHMCLYACVCFV